MIDRDKIIDRLIDDDYDTVMSGGNDYLYGLLYSGFKGYQNYTDEQLITEINERDFQ